MKELDALLDEMEAYVGMPDEPVVLSYDDEGNDAIV